MKIKNNERLRFLIAILIIAVSSFIQAFIIQSMIQAQNLIAMGFTGLAILISMALELVKIKIPIWVFIVSFNIPVALLCAKHISKKFIFLSVLQILLTSVFLIIFDFKPVFSNINLVITIGAFIYGIGMVFALRVGGSTGGTDFIALYVSNKINKAIWEYVFVFNVIMLLIFGYLFGWDRAGYSVIFQYVTTKTISSFYQRYSRVTLQIFTNKYDEIMETYKHNVRHGMTKTMGVGAYTNKEIGILYTVISFYEMSDVVRLIKQIDKNAIINIYNTEYFHGNFYIKPI